jgi:hypothetical protein
MQLALWLAEAKEVTQVRWEGAPDAWQVFLIAALVIAFAAATYLLEPKDERRGWRLPLLLLRALAIGVGVAILFRPLESKELQDVKDGQVLVVIDTSASMELKDRPRDESRWKAEAEAIGIPPEQTRELFRLDRVKMALRKDGGAFVRKLAEKNGVRFFTFDASRERFADVPKTDPSKKSDAGDGSGAATDPVQDALARLEAKKPVGQATALGDALQRILTDVRSERVAGVVLLTDGRSNAGSLTPEAVAARFGRKGVPIFAVAVGDPDPPRDLSVDDFRAPDVCLAGDILQGAVRVKATGYPEPRDVTVRVKLGDEQVFEKVVRVGGATQPGQLPEVDVPFETKVTTPGEYTMVASVEVDPDEVRTDNNSQPRQLRVIDERIKVLYIEGYPRWEYRYLKNALVRDRHIQAQVWLLSADPDFHQEHSDNVAPLTRLPTPEQVLDYHVVVLGDVNPTAIKPRTSEPAFPPGWFEAVAELVKERGGGLLMISGEQSAPRAYATGPLADVLPIFIDTTGARGQDHTRSWRPRLTREGYESPLMRLEPASEEESRQLWDVALPDLYWYVPTERPKPQARVLAVHPRDRNQHGPYPLIAWHRYGSGTVFWLGFDEAWRWRAQVGDKYHYRFYGQVLRFLSLQSFTRSKRFYVTTDKKKYDVGEEVILTAEIRDKDALGDRTAQDVLIEKPDGQTETVALQAEGLEKGKFKGTFKPLHVGKYTARIDPGAAGAQSEVASRDFDVSLPKLETQEPRMDQEGLERLAAASGGKVLSLGELHTIPDQLEPLTEVYRGGRSERELWDQPWVFALFFGLLLLEWIGRKLLRLL